MVLVSLLGRFIVGTWACAQDVKTCISQNCTDPVTVSMVGEGVVFQGMRGYTVPPHAPAVACFTMSVTQHIWLKKKYYRVPIFNPVVSEATRLSGYQP